MSQKEGGEEGDEEGEAPARGLRFCPHDGSRLTPIADTPHWFRCGAEGWKHYFYQRARGEGGEWIDVDTNQPVPRRKLTSKKALEEEGRASGAAPPLTPSKEQRDGSGAPKRGAARKRRAGK